MLVKSSVLWNSLSPHSWLPECCDRTTTIRGSPSLPFTGNLPLFVGDRYRHPRLILVRGSPSSPFTGNLPLSAAYPSPPFAAATSPPLLVVIASPPLFTASARLPLMANASPPAESMASLPTLGQALLDMAPPLEFGAPILTPESPSPPLVPSKPLSPEFPKSASSTPRKCSPVPVPHKCLPEPAPWQYPPELAPRQRTPEPTTRQRPPEPARRQRPPESAPRQHPPEHPSICASRVPPGVRVSRAPPSICASRVPPGVRVSRAPPSVRASRVPPRVRASSQVTFIYIALLTIQIVSQYKLWSADAWKAWIQSVSRSDGGSSPRDDLYSSECQQRLGHLDEPQIHISSEDLAT